MKTKTIDYSVDEKRIFDEMQAVLTEYNKQLDGREPLPLPNYTDDEMAEYSQYREILLGEKYRTV